MTEYIPETIGYIAGLCTTFSAIPQIIKCYKSKSAKDLSYITLGMVETGLLLWITYGALDKNYPIVVWNVVSTAINTTLIVMKSRYDKLENKPQQPSIERLKLIPNKNNSSNV